MRRGEWLTEGPDTKEIIATSILFVNFKGNYQDLFLRVVFRICF